MRIMEKQSIHEWARLLEGIDPKSKNARVAKRILKLAMLPRRRRVTVDLNQLTRYANKDENIVVPGKILGTGYIGKAFPIAAMECSESAKLKLKHAGCSMVSLEEMLKKEKLKVII